MDDNVPATDAEWAERQFQWQRRLGRLRLGVEPLEVQLSRYRRVTWVLTAVPATMGLMFVALFTAFRRPDVGLVLASMLFVPIATMAWLDYRRLERIVAAYEHERAAFEARKMTGP
jgi:hypothetical protein